MAFRLLNSDITSSGGTRIMISQDFPNCLITTTVKGNIKEKSDQEQVEAALEQFYQEVFPNRAENEKFEQLGDKIKEVDEKLKQIDKVKKELEITQGSVMDLITQLGGLLEKGEHGENKTTENNDKGGDNNDGNVVRN